MIRGNFIGAAIVAIIYTVFILMNPNAVRAKMGRTGQIVVLVILNALTIVLMAYAFNGAPIF